MTSIVQHDTANGVVLAVPHGEAPCHPVAVHEPSLHALLHHVTRALTRPRGYLHAQLALYPPHPVLQALLATPLRQGAQRVDERVEHGVERQHEDGHQHVHHLGEGRPGRRQQPHHTHREPAAEVGDDDQEEAPGDGSGSSRGGGVGVGVVVVLAPPLPLLLHHPGRHRRSAAAEGEEHHGLADADEDEEQEVEDDENEEGVVVPGERVAGDGQRDADARLAVELPVSGQQGHRRNEEPQNPGGAAG